MGSAPLFSNPGTLFFAVVGTPFSQSFPASGGTTPYTWRIATGSLPTGLSLNASTGVISGTPSAATSGSIVLQVLGANRYQLGCLLGAWTDSSGNVIAPVFFGNGPITLTCPTGASQLQIGINDDFDDFGGGNTGSYSITVNGSPYSVVAHQQPWLFTAGINAAYPYGSGVGVAPIVVSCVPGNTLTVAYVSGSMSLASTSCPDANGAPGVDQDLVPGMSGGNGFPAFYLRSASLSITVVALVSGSNRWLVTYEVSGSPPSGSYIDRSQYIDFNDGAQNTFQLMLRQRGRATIPFRVKANDSYVPTMGMQLFLFDNTPSGWTLVFAGSVDDCVLTYVGLGGDRLYTVTAVTFDQCLDVVLVPPQTFPAGSNCGSIVTALFNTLMSGAPISLGTISSGATLGTPYTISDWTPLSQVINDLATISQNIWGINYQALTLYFTPPITTAAPFTLATNQVRNPGGKPSWSWRNKRQDYRNRQINKIAASAFSPSSELFTGGGTSFTLKRPPATVTNAWVTQNTQNHATATLTGNPSNGDTVTVSYPSAGSIYNWAANSPYATGQIIVDPAGHIQKVTTQGTSGATIPTFSDTTTGGGTTSDGPGTPDPPPFNGAVIWTDQGIAGGGLYDALVYTFVTTLDNTQWGQVLIGASAAATAQNLADAINATQAVAGLTFSWPTWENPLLNAGTVSGSSFVVSNKAAGAGYIAALAKTGTALSWSAGVTSGGSTASSTTYVLQVAQNGSSNTANLYWTPGSTTVAVASIPQSAVALPLSGWNLQVQYTRQGGDSIVCERSDLVAARAIIEGGTGKYQAKTSDTNQVNANLGLLECQEDLAAYDTLPVELTFATFIPGLTTGQYLNISVLDVPVGVAALINGQYVIQEIRAKLIRTKPWMNQRTVPGGGHYEYTVTVINVGVIGSYLDFWKGNLGSGGGASSAVVGLAVGSSPAGSGIPVSTIVVGFIIESGTVGTNVGPRLPSPSAATVSSCVLVVQNSDPSVNLSATINLNGSGIVTVTSTAGTASGTLTTTPITGAPVAIAKNDQFTIDIGSGTGAWQFTAQVE